MSAILQKNLPFAPWMEAQTARLPGVQPVSMEDWLQVDEAYTAQLSKKAILLQDHGPDVLAMQPQAEEAAKELLQLVVDTLSKRADFTVSDERIVRPDGVSVALSGASPLETLSRLVQEDFAILIKGQGEHILRGALICFPASWKLSEKIGRPLSTIHEPVESYSSDIGKRVQRLFDAVRPGKPLMRANALMYLEPDLFQPRPQGDTKPMRDGDPAYMRSERQTILRLPETDAVVFSIHTYVVAWENLTMQQQESWRASG